MGFPYPIIGNIPQFIKAMKDYKNVDLIPLQFYLEKKHGQNVPGVVADFRHSDGHLIISDPLIIEELFVNKNKYFDKYNRSKDILFSITGNSMLFDKSNELWMQKRKTLSAAFYKEKMIKMLNFIIQFTDKKVEEWKNKYADKQVTMNLGREVSDHIMECIHICVFG